MKMSLIPALMTSALISVSAFAASPAPTGLQPGDEDVRFIGGKAFGMVSPDCMPSRPCDPSARMHIVLELSSCMNRLGPTSHTVTRDTDGTAHVYIAATEIVTEDSKKVVCVAPGRASYWVNLGMGFFTKTQVTFLGVPSAPLK